MKNLIFVILIALGIMACDNNQNSKKEGDTSVNLKVFAVNYPLLYFAERIGGDHIDLIFPIPDNVDPAYWVPYQAIKEIQNADLILDNGANYAKWMEKVSLPSSKVVNTSEAFKDHYIKEQEGASHSHGGDGDHVHYGFAFTTWLNFKFAGQQAEAILEVLISKRPQFKEVFTANFNTLKTELQKLDLQMSALSEKLPETAIFASHPVYQYLGERYNLNIISEHWEPGEIPTEIQWEEFKHNLDLHPANLMLWEGEPADELKLRLKDAKVTTVLFNPCSNKPIEGDFLTILKQNISNLKKYIEESC